MSLLRHTARIAWKDLRVELRSKEILFTMLFFAVMVILIFSFAFLREGTAVADVSGGILWISVAFSGMLGLSRAFDREREGDTMRGLLLSPAPRGAIFLGKAAGVATFMLLVQAVVVPLIGLLFGAPIQNRPLDLAALLVLGTLGFAVVGSVFAAMLLRARSREVLLAVVVYPIVMPALIAGTKGTAALLEASPALPVAHFWIKFLLVFDAILLSVALWAFESLVVE